MRSAHKGSHEGARQLQRSLGRRRPPPYFAISAVQGLTDARSMCLKDSLRAGSPQPVEDPLGTGIVPGALESLTQLMPVTGSLNLRNRCANIRSGSLGERRVGTSIIGRGVEEADELSQRLAHGRSGVISHVRLSLQCLCVAT
jgi:hypothetical protein